MIAGTFTPFCLILMKNPLGWTVLGLIWTLAVLGIALKAIFPHVPRWLMTSLFIGMGWMGILIVKPVYQAIHWQGFLFLLLGGIFYTVGGLIYGLEKPNPIPGKFGFHEIWHCFVLAGAASHFYLMYFYL
jgi:hemolysin III